MKEKKYEEAFAELQTIVHKMENDELDIDQMTEQLKRAQQLIKLCKDKLTKTDEEIKKILGEEKSNFAKFVSFVKNAYLCPIENTVNQLIYEEFRLGQPVVWLHED